MNVPIVLNGETIGNCCLEERGLYWSVDASCVLSSDRVERLYCGSRRLGVLEREGDCLTLRRQVSKSSYPELPPASGVLTLHPMNPAVPWSGMVYGHALSGFRIGDTLLFPYEKDAPCPCEPLFCFFEIRDGFWRLPLLEEKE